MDSTQSANTPTPPVLPADESGRTFLPSGTQLLGGAYKIGHPIGLGGFSLTYYGYEGSRRLPVAIKEMFPIGCTRDGLRIKPDKHWDAASFANSLKSFLGEGRLLERFNHACIVKVYAIFEENDTAYMVMEFLDGESLFHGTQQRGAMNLPQAFEVARQVGEALSIVHSGGLIHSDVKPENIIRTSDGRLVLLDFGVSRGYLTESSSKGAPMAVSPGYAPPEQYQRNKSLNPTADVYALGATLVHLLTRRPPPDAIRRHKGALLPVLEDCNPTVTPKAARAIENALDLDSTKRPESVKEFLHALGCLEEVGERPTLGATNVPAQITFNKVREVAAHRGALTGLKRHPDGKLLLSAGVDGWIRLWSWPLLEAVGSIHAHEHAITGVTFSPDGLFLATSCAQGEVKLWDVKAGALVACIKKGLPPVHALAFSPDGTTLAIGISTGCIELHSPKYSRAVSLPGHTGSVTSLAFSPSGLVLASGGNDSQIQLWNIARQKRLHSMTAHLRAVQSLRFSEDGKLLASSSNDLSVKIWDVEAGLELRIFKGHGAMVWAADFTCNPDIVATGCSDKKLRLFKLDTGRELASQEADTHSVRHIECDRHQPLIATGGGDSKLRLWQFSST